MYAIIELGGRQWKVEPGSRLEVNRVTTAVGKSLTVSQVLLAHDGDQALIGRPYIDGAQIICEVVEHHQGPKVISYHYRRRENWRKTRGHRQHLSRLLVKDIQWPGRKTQPEEAHAVRPAAKARGAGLVKKTPTIASKPRKISGLSRKKE